MKHRIRISTDGESIVHVEYHGSGYSTLCGLDGSDSSIDRIVDMLMESWPNAIGEARADSAAPPHDQTL
jgi:hypothetical protein